MCLTTPGFSALTYPTLIFEQCVPEISTESKCTGILMVVANGFLTCWTLYRIPWLISFKVGPVGEQYIDLGPDILTSCGNSIQFLAKNEFVAIMHTWSGDGLSLLISVCSISDFMRFPTVVWTSMVVDSSLLQLQRVSERRNCLDAVAVGCSTT